MINEINQLATALKNAHITTSPWHHRYGPIAKIKRDAPCIQVVLDGNRVSRLLSVSSEKGMNIRRYGDKQGSFPAMNLTPLYRITDENVAKAISALIATQGENLDIDLVHTWCISNNWTEKFCSKYRQCITPRPQELLSLLGERHAPLTSLIRAVEPFRDPTVLHRELERKAFEMLEDRDGVVPALQILFYLPTKKEQEKAETGKLSAVLDTEELIDEGYSTAGPKFAAQLNEALLQADSLSHSGQATNAVDAFGEDYIPLDEPMPSVKLDAGFEVSLRTMFRGQPCQSRYGCFEGESYPLSKSKRLGLSAALEWVSRGEREDKTWVKTDKNEAMFVFPSRLSADYPSMTAFFKKPADEETDEGLFEAKAKDFAEYLTRTKTLDPECYPEWIQFFVIRKLDKARSKVVYTYNASPEEIIRQSDCWQKAADNLPAFRFGNPWVLFPLRTPFTLNRVWKRDGTAVGEQHKEVPAFHGMELFFGVPASVLRHDLRLLVKNTAPLAVYAGERLNSAWRRDLRPMAELRAALALMGMLLFWLDCRKDDYMNEYPYLLGQLLKAADYLHELYCVCVRGNKYDELPQLIGGSLYTSAAEFPNRTLVQLMQRMKPYLNWARSHRSAAMVTAKQGGEQMYSPPAGYYLSVFSRIADKLLPALTPDVRFTDAEKAQLFIGYLASFPKKDTLQMQQSEEQTCFEKGE